MFSGFFTESTSYKLRLPADLVWETEMSSSITGEQVTMHVALGTDRWKDNRIPPKGYDTAHMNERQSQPRWNGADAPNYFTAAEYAGGYDKVTVSKPTGATSWNATLYYQTTSKEFVEYIRNEINGTANTLVSPTPSGEPQAYIIQTDPSSPPSRDGVTRSGTSGCTTEARRPSRWRPPAWRRPLHALRRARRRASPPRAAGRK